MAKKIYINELELGKKIKTAFLILDLSVLQTSRGSDYLNLNLADKSGKINAKVWDVNNSLKQNLINGKVAQIVGYVDSYKQVPQIIIEKAQILNDDEVQWEEFLKSSPFNPQEMKKEFWDIIETEFKDADYKAITRSAFENAEVRDLFFHMPAAKSFHHAYRYGLLEHSLSVAKLALVISQHYGPLLNKDLLLAGALLHDLGKIWEFTQDVSTNYSTQGLLLGHIFMGSQFLFKIEKEIENFPPNKLELLQHLIISHHGEYEYGSPRKPHTLEALALHAADNLDAKIIGVKTFLNESLNQETGWTTYHRLLDNYFYKTEFSELEEPPNNHNNRELELELKSKKKKKNKDIDNVEKENLSKEPKLF